MEDNTKKINELLQRIEELTSRNEQFSKELYQIKQEIQALKQSPATETAAQTAPLEDASVVQKLTAPPTVGEQQTQVQQRPHPKQKPVKIRKTKKERSNLEEIIGGRVMTIVGIVITVIGIGLGAKYAIDKNWLSPIVRIILGYMAGIILMGIALKLRKKYEAFSAALLSGGISVMYFISFFAYSFYDIIPPVAAFVLMLAFTIFAVLSAIQYNQQIIAHLGLVGAYAIPFITDTGLDNASILFTYIVIINTGILVIAFKKNWRALNYVAFGFSWLIFTVWFFDTRAYIHNIKLSFSFALIFFVQFYLLTIAYKLVRKEKFGAGDVILMLLNSFLFYGLGYSIITEGMEKEKYLGLFTIGNAVLHLILVLLLWVKRVEDKQFRLFALGLVITFITIAIPVQLNGYWVTLLWTVEAIVLFWVGRSGNTSIYEYLSYPLIFLAFFSLMHDWYSIYPQYYRNSDPDMTLNFIFNLHFLNSILVATGLGMLIVINRNKKYLEGKEGKLPFLQFLNFALPLLVFFVVFYSLRMEIVTYWNKQMTSFTFRGNDYNRHIRMFRRLTLHDYYMIYIIALFALNRKVFKSITYAYITQMLGLLLLFAFIVPGLHRIGYLKEDYASSLHSEEGAIGTINIWIGYISYAVAGSLLLCTQISVKQFTNEKGYRKLISIFSHFIILSILTGELYHSLDKLSDVANPNIFISILWGLYAVMIISVGIAQKRKHLRISAIFLFGITLFKLFIYDISNVTALGRVILLFSLGILLIIIAFLYAKYKHIILMKDED